MPVYEYRCKECGYEFDKHQSFAEARLTDCPSCEARGALRKVFGNVGVTFKGSGFYRTDSRSTDSSSLSSNGSQNGAKPSESKSESKPAATSTTASTASGSGSAAKAA
ncbi:zinc ribbon domain-containing protein [Glycomyces sp. TRM65418]|uniref:FmdB family zinc ribbon protein n=1 Tax=Glycomyces sp. TRM65418 TaxID=2867006 RepID=UPI001CE62C5F|nr:zinc ribbon domain-containing protein [Glycomyces sp. TRM65418]MCC3763667.1 zinc ribbon domain-containing protein [Glycomyces sp. TRM65418]QZD57649.1 zinc ribbon domain-containing protein [Glycomyces sp. TRM65418]